MFAIFLGTVGKGNLRKAFENSVRTIEARNKGAAGTNP